MTEPSRRAATNDTAESDLAKLLHLWRRHLAAREGDEIGS